MRIKIEKIVIKNRVREEIGDLETLVQSLSKHGLLNPVTLNKNYELIAGFRRICAAKKLGWEDIECRFIESKNKLEKFEMEMEENLVRKDFTEREIAKSIEIRERLTARGWKKLLLLLKRFWLWLKGLFIKKDEN